VDDGVKGSKLGLSKGKDNVQVVCSMGDGNKENRMKAVGGERVQEPKKTSADARKEREIKRSYS